MEKWVLCTAAVLLLVVSTWAAPGTQPQSATTATQPAAPEAPVTLNDLMQEALSRNPALAAAGATVEVNRHKIPQAKSLPDPMLSVGWMGNPAPFTVQSGDPSSGRIISVSQQLPFPGKLKLRGEIADRETEASRWDYEATRRRVIAEVKTAYYEYWFATKALEIANKDKDLLQKLAQIAEVRYRVGKSVQQDVIKSQLELSLLLQRTTVLEQQRRVAQARLNSLLYRDPEAPLPPPAGVQQSTLDQPLEQLYALARQNDPELQREQRMVERGQYAVQLAAKETRPDFGIAYTYEQRPLMPDMHGFTFSINLPVWAKTKQHEMANEAAADLNASSKTREARQAQLYFELKEQYLAAKASEELLKLYSQAVVPQSSLALESSMSSYEVGSVDFLTVMGNFRSVLDYELSFYRELANYQIALARMEPLVGVELTK